MTTSIQGTAVLGARGRLVQWAGRVRGLDLQVLGLAIALVAVAGAGMMASPFFLTGDNILNVCRQAAIVALLGLAVTLALIAGIVDFSVGATLALTSVVVALLQERSAGLTLAVLAVMVLGLGLVKGLLVAYVRLESLITTLALALVLDGIAFAISDQQIIPVASRGWRWPGAGTVLGVPAPVVILALAAAVTHVVLRRTVYGKFLYATGGNALAAEIAGVRTRRVQTQVLLASAAIACLAGVVFTGRIAAGDPTVGTAQTLDAVVVAVLGGASLFGGKGSVPGLLLAALLIAFVFNVFNLLSLPLYWQLIARGGILLGAISIDVFRKR